MAARYEDSISMMEAYHRGALAPKPAPSDPYLGNLTGVVPTRGGAVRGAYLSVTMARMMGIPKATVAYLGNPAAVDILIDAEQGVIALRPGSSYLVRKAGASGGALLSMGAVWKALGWSPQPRKYLCALRDGMAVIQIEPQDRERV